MKNTLVTFDDLGIEALTKSCREAFNDVEDVFFIVEANLNRLETFGRLLTAAKSKVPHGQWEDWITDTFEGRLNPRTARRWMSDSKRTQMAVLESESSGNSGEVPRESRKPGRVAVVEQDDKDDDDDDSEIIDDDPTPDPPTIRKTAAGSKKVAESDKPKTRPVVAEILEDSEDGAVVLRESDTSGIRELFRRCVLVDEGDLKFVIESLIRKTENKHGQKKLAAVLRKWGNELDPPDESKPKTPTATALRAVCEYETMSEEMLLAVHDWVRYKQNNPEKVYRYKTIQSWEKDLRRMLKVATQSGESCVIEALDKAESKGWRGWELNEQNGKANGNGRSREQEREKRNADSFAIFERAAEERDAARLG